MRAYNVFAMIDNFIRNFEGIVLTNGSIEELGITYGFAHVLHDARTFIRVEVDESTFKTYIVGDTVVRCPDGCKTFGHIEKVIEFDGQGVDNVKCYLSDIFPCYGIYEKDDCE